MIALTVFFFISCMVIWGFWKIYLFLGLGEILSIIGSYITFIFICYAIEEIFPSHCESLYESRIRYMENKLDQLPLEIIEGQRQLDNFREKHRKIERW